jgi:hypothetical protein
MVGAMAKLVEKTEKNDLVQKAQTLSVQFSTELPVMAKGL